MMTPTSVDKDEHRRLTASAVSRLAIRLDAIRADNEALRDELVACRGALSETLRERDRARSEAVALRQELANVSPARRP